jgi:hypothetical protein
MFTFFTSSASGLRRLITVGAATAVLIGGIGIGTGATPSANAAPIGTVMTKTQRMSEPTLASRQIGWYAQGTRLVLSCFRWGQAVRGYYSPWIGNGGYDSLWYQTQDGSYVADVDLNTGSNQPVTPACGGVGPNQTSTPSLASKVDSFVAQYKNQFVDFDRRYGAQCVDLFNFYNRDIVKSGFVSVDYAYQLWTAAPASRYQRISASATPVKGDVAIYGSGLPGSGGAGHVAIVLGQVNSSTLSLFQQRVKLPNGTYSGAIVSNGSKSYLLGYLRPIG